MHRLLNARPSASTRWARRLTGAALASLGLCGCAGFWDEVTSRDFHVKALFVKPDPLIVLRDSNDGDERARALRALQEPKAHDGTDEEQDAIVQILTTAAVSERQPLCRLAAIQTLGRFQDPRAVQGLVDAFYQASSFSPETTTVLRCQAVTALGKTGNPAAVELLARVVREPPAEGTEQEKQQTLDVRIAAARALGNFSQQQSTEALVRVLQTEKDVALRDRAHESLQLVTGKELPPDAKAWEDFLQQTVEKDVAEQRTKEKILGAF
ncbi:MAG: HEAT repeat domain-containing protein [Gemmataceae bacterium]|nr:HEAT repeat domain-containing protein [Gemmataceae bacterium]